MDHQMESRIFHIIVIILALIILYYSYKNYQNSKIVQNQYTRYV